MYCTRCGKELRDDDCYCSRCGYQTPVAPPSAEPRVLMLDKRNKKIAGVCAGFARYLGVDVVLVRLIWLALALCTGGMGLIVYIAAWIIVPSDRAVSGDLTLQRPRQIEAPLA